MSRRVIRFLALSIGVPLAAVLALGYAVKDGWIPIPYGVTAPAPSYPSPRTDAEAQRDDLDYLRNITRLDWSYTEATRAKANKIIDDALRGRLPLSKAAFQLVVARVLATADNGHTNTRGGTTANQFNRLPLRFYVFADGIFVVRAEAAQSALLGLQLVAVDGVPVETVRARLRPYTGGTENEKNSRLPFYLESPALLNAAGIAASPDEVALSLADAAGKTRTATIAALAPAPSAPKLWPSDELHPQRDSGEGRSWIAALNGPASRLLMFAGAPSPFFAGPVPGMRAYYVRFGTNSDEGSVSIADFASRTLDTLRNENPPVVIVDLRMNGGGDYTLTANFMRKMPGLLSRSTIYVLVSQETFSAGITDAAFLKQAGGDRVIFVGDWPGDRLRFHSEGGDFCLPFSHICMPARTAIHDYSTTDCRPFFECFWLNRFYPVAIRSLAPEIYAPLRFRALAAGHDPAFDAIFDRMHSSRQSETTKPRIGPASRQRRI